MQPFAPPLNVQRPDSRGDNARGLTPMGVQNPILKPTVR